MIKHLTYMFIFILLAGCATTSGVSPDSLSKPKHITEFTLQDDVADVMIVTNAFGTKSERLSGLVKGRYLSKYEDEKGVFYEGPVNCLIQSKSSGGIYLPKKGTDEKPAFWAYIIGLPESERVKAGLIVAMGDSWEEGRIRKDWWTTVSSKLLSAIKVLKATEGLKNDQ